MAKAAAAFTSFTTIVTRRRINVPVSPVFLVRRSSLPPLQLQLQPSPVEALQNVFDDDKENKMRVFVKRDDKLDLLGAGIFGNKARKLMGLASSFSSSSSSFPSACVSWGGPQSNALLALAGLVCGVHKKRFVYYTKTIPHWLKAQPLGNYQRALELGVEFREVPAVEYCALFGTEGEKGGEGGEEGAMAGVVSLKDLPVSQEEGFRAVEGDDVLLVPQGAAFQGAEEGLCLLAVEIEDWWRVEKSRIERGTERGASLAVVLPAGTGTTAFYLAKHFKRLRAVGNGTEREEIMVYAVPCVGDGDYLKAQMARLSSSSISGEGGREERSTEGLSSASLSGEGGREGRSAGDNDVFPQILQGSMPHVFGKPEQALLDIWQEIKARHALELDLLYGPHAWRVMCEKWEGLAAKHACVLYIHTGGLEGSDSLLGRYRHLGMLK
jgi:1-aminocyclopropane-1-carboxylate deaminase/D-cysteine desulfhydrase-like pyridoxal-dependent ACC family enzyme